ncbi:hypothetical protein GCM10011381_30370 [Klenkia taihuensis]|nr:hypothetical protein GCM10011381_30370 [Klenkia taihuensis]
MPVTAVALIAAAVLHALTCLLLTTSLPQYVPVVFDASLEPAVAGTRVLATALALGDGVVVAGTAAVAGGYLAYLVTWAVAVRRTRPGARS